MSIKINLLVVSALSEEHAVACQVLEHVCGKSVSQSIGNIDISTFKLKIGEMPHEILVVGACSAHAMGAVSMGAFATSVFSVLRPDCAVLVGIAASVSSEGLNLGDVPVASEVVAYDNVAVQEGKLDFRPQGFQVDPQLRRAAGELRSSLRHYGSWQDSCIESIAVVVPNLNRMRPVSIVLPDNIRRPHLLLELGAGGPFLVRDAAFLESLKTGKGATTRVHSKVAWVEMESHGFMAAAHEKSVPAIVMKGISDCGDVAKADLEKSSGGYFRAFACANSVMAAVHIARLRASSNQVDQISEVNQPPLDQPSLTIAGIASHVAARSIMVLEQGTAGLWSKILSSAGIVSASDPIRPTRFGGEESGFDAYFVESGSAERLLLCARAPRHPVPMSMIERMNLFVDTKYPGGVIVISLDELLQDVEDAARILSTKQKPLRVVGAHELLASLEPTSQETIGVLRSGRGALARVEVVFSADDWFHLLFDAVGNSWFELRRPDGSLVSPHENVVSQVRESRHELQKAAYGVLKAEQTREDRPSEFNRDAYLVACKSEYQRVRYHALSLIGMRMDDRVRLENLYVENTAECTDTTESSAIVDQYIEDQLGPVLETGVIRDRIRKQILASIGSGVAGTSDLLGRYFEENALLAVLGDPGSGKSVSTKREILRYCDPAAKIARVHTPVFVSLVDAARSFEGVAQADTLGKVLSIAADQAQRLGLPISEADIVQLESVGLLALFLDGFDEVSDQSARFAILEALKIFARRAENSGNRVVLTSRPGALRSMPLPRGMQIVHVSPFSIKDIERLGTFLLKVGCDDKSQTSLDTVTVGPTQRKALDTLLKDCRSNRSIMRLAQNPFLLTMLVGVYLEGVGKVIMRRSGIYQESVRILTHVRNRQLGQHVPSSSDVDRALSAVAEAALIRPGASIDSEHVVDLVCQSLTDADGVPPTPSEASTLLSQADNAGLINFRRSDLNADAAQTNFRHFSFLEYFASISVEKSGSDRIIECARRPQWHTVAILAGARASENGGATDLLRSVLSTQSDPGDALTGRSLELALELADEMTDIPSAARRLLAKAIIESLQTGALRSNGAYRKEVAALIGEIVGATGEPAIIRVLIEGVTSADSVVSAAALDLVSRFPVEIEFSADLLKAIRSREESGDVIVCDAFVNALERRVELRTEDGVRRLRTQLDSKAISRRYVALRVVEAVPSFYALVSREMTRCLEDKNRVIAGIAGRAILRGLTDSGAKLDILDESTAQLVGRALERWGDIAQPGSSRQISLNVDRDQVRTLLGSPNGRLLGIRLLPWVANADGWMIEKIRENALSEHSVTEEIVAGLSVLAMTESSRRYFQERDFQRINEVAVSSGDRRARISALRALAATRGGRSTVECMARRAASIESSKQDATEHRLVVDALCRAGRSEEYARTIIFDQTVRCFRNQSFVNPHFAYAMTWAQACQDVGGDAPSDLCKVLYERAADYRLDRKNRNKLFKIWSRIHPLDGSLVRSLEQALRDPNGAVFEDACMALGPVVERVRSSIEYLVRAEAFLGPLRAVVISNSRSIVSRARGEISSEYLEQARRAIREIDDILSTTTDYLLLTPSDN